MKEYKIIYDGPKTDAESELNTLAAQGYVLKFVIPAVDKPRVDGDEFIFGQYIMERDGVDGQAVQS